MKRLQMSSVFLSVDREYSDLMRYAQQKLQQKVPDHRNLLSIKKDLCQAQKLLKQMQKQIPLLPPSVKSYHFSAVKQKRKDWQQSFDQLKNLQKGFYKTAQELYGAADQRKLLNSHNLLQEQVHKLEAGQKASFEAENQAIQTMGILKKQGDQIRRAKYGATDIEKNLNSSTKLINSMQRQSITNKLMMVAIIILLVVSILVVAYMKFIN